MTNEQKLLVYLYGVDSIQHKQLAIALSDIPYQCVTKALRAAKKHGYVEVFMRDESRYVRISQDGLKYIRSTQKDALDVDKRAAMKRRIKGEHQGGNDTLHVPSSGNSTCQGSWNQAD
mgnify:CR=1 FL=1